MLLCSRSDHSALLQSGFFSQDFRGNVLFFSKFFEGETFNFIAHSQYLIGVELQINLALALGSFQIPNHLCAELPTDLFPPISHRTIVSVYSTRWNYSKKKPHSSSDLTTDFPYSTTHSTIVIFEEGVRLKFFCEVAVQIATHRSEISKSSLYVWSRSVTNFSFL